MNKPLINYLALCLVLFAATACVGVIRDNEAVQATPIRMNYPKPSSDLVQYSELLWVDGNLLGFTDESSALEYAEVNSKTFAVIPLPKDDYCTMSTQYHVNSAFSDGSLSLIKRCFTDNEDGTPTYIATYNWGTKELKILTERMPLGTANVYWSPDGKRGLVMLGRTMNSTFYRIDAEGNFGPLDLVISDEGKSWNLRNFYPDLSDEAAAYSGNVERAGWSPDGKWVAFFGSSDVIGEEDFGRIGKESKIFIMNSDYQNIHPVLGGIYSPGDQLRWSPDSKFIAFTANYEQRDGLFIFSLKDHSVKLVDKGLFSSMQWHFAEPKLYAVRCDKEYYCADIFEYDLSSYLNGD